MSIAWRLESFYCSGAVGFLIDKELEKHISFVWLVLPKGKPEFLEML